MNDNDFKLKITRSDSKKINLGNYESQDVFCSLALEISADAEPIEVIHRANELHALCVSLNEYAIKNIKNTDGVGINDLTEMIERMDNKTNMMTVKEYQEIMPTLSSGENKLFNACRRWVNRSARHAVEEYKKQEGINGTTNM